MSVSSDLIVDNKRITPFLDSLKHAEDVYYNGQVRSNITIGESGDGQFIYMTGLMPLRSKYTVGEAKHNTMPFALPSVLQKTMKIKHTEIIIPSSLSVWQQEAMNKVYGFQCCYSKKQVADNNGEDLTDETVFQLAKNTSMVYHQPFFSLVLSISTHQPYRDFIDPNFNLNDNTLPQNYLRYLNACHFLDTQLKKYFDYLKMMRVYDNSLIIVASDHHAHLDALDMKGKLSTDLPLYIIHGNISKNAYTGPCNQLDIYTTILDLLNCQCDWHGLGRSLISGRYVNSVTQKTWIMSEWIILSDYFANNNHNY